MAKRKKKTAKRKPKRATEKKKVAPKEADAVEETEAEESAEAEERAQAEEKTEPKAESKTKPEPKAKREPKPRPKRGKGKGRKGKGRGKGKGTGKGKGGGELPDLARRHDLRPRAAHPGDARALLSRHEVARLVPPLEPHADDARRVPRVARAGDARSRLVGLARPRLLRRRAHHHGERRALGAALRAEEQRQGRREQRRRHADADQRRGLPAAPAPERAGGPRRRGGRVRLRRLGRHVAPVPRAERRRDRARALDPRGGPLLRGREPPRLPPRSLALRRDGPARGDQRRRPQLPRVHAADVRRHHQRARRTPGSRASAISSRSITGASRSSACAPAASTASGCSSTS